MTADNSFPLLANDTVLYNRNANSNAALLKGVGDVNRTGPPSTSLTSSLVSTQVPSTTSTPAMFTGGASSLSINTAILIGMISVVLGSLLLI
jgi:hypothetical protein